MTDIGMFRMAKRRQPNRGYRRRIEEREMLIRRRKNRDGRIGTKDLEADRSRSSAS